MDKDFLQKNHLTLIGNERFLVNLMYATSENITQIPVYQDFGLSQAYVHHDVYEALLKLVPTLKKEKLKLKFYDAYRAPEAHRKLRQLVPINGFFASCPEASLHCRGTAVDVCLCDEAGVELAYPTPVDCYLPQFAKDIQSQNTQAFFDYLQHARHDYTEASIEETNNREYLKALMESVGFESIIHEWWHYNFKNGQSYPLIYLD